MIVILAAAGIIGTVLYSGSRKTEAFFVNLQQIIPKSGQKEIKNPTLNYAYVTSDALNIRSGPFVDNKIVGQLTKDQRVEIVDSSGQWWKIKTENIEGYVDSNFEPINKFV